MNQTNQPRETFDDEVNVVDLLLMLLKHKKIMISITVLAGFVSILYSLLQPNMYEATASILPPREPQSGLSSLVSQTGGALGGISASLFGGGSTTELYVGILQSRSVANSLIEEFDLKTLYGQEFFSDTQERLAERTHIKLSADTQIIEISVEDEDPQRAADMANAYVDALDRINRTLVVTEGQKKRRFLEDRLGKVKVDLAKAESELRTFQEEYKLVAIEEQARASIEGAAKIKGQIIAAQTELEVLKEFGTEKQNEAVMLNSKITELQHQLAKIESGNPGENKDDFYIPFKELPELSMQLARLMREAQVQEEVFKLITTQYELAKIEEAKDVNTIQVLDWAVPPDTESGVGAKLVVMISTAAGLFLAVITVLVLEFIERLKAHDLDRYQQLIQGVKLR